MPDWSRTSTSRLSALRRRPKSVTPRGGDGVGPLTRLAESPRAGWAFMVSIIFVVTCGILAVWAREQPLVAVGRVMNDTRLVRVPVVTENPAATEELRETARQNTPRVLVAEAAAFLELRSDLENLPRTLAGVTDLAQVEPGIRELFKLDADRLAEVQAQAAEGQPTRQWREAVTRFLMELETVPLLDTATWQRAQQEGRVNELALVLPAGIEPRLETPGGREKPRAGGDRALAGDRRDVINISSRDELGRVAVLAARAGFGPALQGLIVDRLWNNGQARPTFRYDAASTAQAMQERAAAVRPVIKESPLNQVIFARGDVLTEAQLELYKAELNKFRTAAEGWRAWLRSVSLVAAVSAITLALVGYTALFGKRIRRNPGRMIGVCVLLAAALAIAVFATVAKPDLGALTVVVPTIFVAIILCLAYDQRVALAFCVMHGLMVCVALDQSIGMYATTVLGVCCVVWQLREVRDRDTLVWMSLFTALGVSAATCVIGFIERPLLTPAGAQVVWEIVTDAGLAAAGCVVAGGVTMFILPTVERLFDITTGMTLIELRDPKQPLLRELQMRAPGTYSHSLNVASIAEAAADAIGADSLLTYVGALYHDIGKMNKPDYFVENQSAGFNKHDRLTPAMSLLVIVGHVKDGMELAHEFGLPRSLQHFIESHHGTTLVEFFFHRAKQQALARARAEAAAEGKPETPRDPAAREPVAGDFDDTLIPDEFEFRYPGPKPQTKEGAILMISDAVESATRAMAEPTPARIEQVVRTIANKRLLDGQFDECEITLRDLNRIVESISRTLASIYHGRVAYPGGAAQRA